MSSVLHNFSSLLLSFEYTDRILIFFMCLEYALFRIMSTYVWLARIQIIACELHLIKYLSADLSYLRFIVAAISSLSIIRVDC